MTRNQEIPYIEIFMRKGQVTLEVTVKQSSDDEENVNALGRKPSDVFTQVLAQAESFCFCSGTRGADSRRIDTRDAPPHSPQKRFHRKPSSFEPARRTNLTNYPLELFFHPESRIAGHALKSTASQGYAEQHYYHSE